ncbi:unnamed protein product [Vicia faba]|uniref:Uncharacterized protein n=1 Tax=Vicia faba TaxID=3906 RepID=A0AAV1B680_VICFA|nr:unnamed protein product [Vicia faba]
MKGGSGQEELDWDSYDKIKEQLLGRKGKEKLMATAAAEKIVRSWMENIAKAAKEGGSEEQELDWDSYEKINEEMILLNKLQRSSEKANAKEMAKPEAEKEAQIKAIKRVRLTQKKRDLRRRAKARENKKSQPYKKAEQDKLKVGSKLTKDHVSNVSSEVAEKGDIMHSKFPTHVKLDLELIIREKMQKKVSFAEQIQAAKLIKRKLK